MTVKPLEGQKALVTGGDSGIGAGLVIAFARAGAAVGIKFPSQRDSRGCAGQNHPR